MSIGSQTRLREVSSLEDEFASKKGRVNTPVVLRKIRSCMYLLEYDLSAEQWRDRMDVQRGINSLRSIENSLQKKAEIRTISREREKRSFIFWN